MIGMTNAVNLNGFYNLTVSLKVSNTTSSDLTLSSTLFSKDANNYIDAQTKDMNVPANSALQTYAWVFENLPEGTYEISDSYNGTSKTRTIELKNNMEIVSPLDFSEATLTVIYPPGTSYYITNGFKTYSPDDNSTGSNNFTISEKGIWNIYYQGSYWASINIDMSGASYSQHIGYLYNEGNEENFITGGWEPIKTNASGAVKTPVSNVTKGTTSITLGTTSTNRSSNVYIIKTNSSINLTNYNSLYLHVVKQRNNNVTKTTSKLTVLADTAVSTELCKDTTTTEKTDKSYALDLSNITDSYPIQVSTQATSTNGYVFYVEFDKMWVE